MMNSVLTMKKISWKNRYNGGLTPKEGQIYILNPNSDKSDWSPEHSYISAPHEFTLKKGLDNNSQKWALMYRDSPENTWFMDEEFLKEHLILIN